MIQKVRYIECHRKTMKNGSNAKQTDIGCLKILRKYPTYGRISLKFILPKYFGRLCRYYVVWSVIRKPGVSQKTHTNLMKTRRHAKKIGDASGLPLVLP